MWYRLIYGGLYYYRSHKGATYVVNNCGWCLLSNDVQISRLHRVKKPNANWSSDFLAAINEE